MNEKRILISRTDAIGDVVLTLSICKLIKEQIPNSIITFIGKTYTKDLINSCASVDHFIDFNEIEKLGKADQIIHFEKGNYDSILHVFPNRKIAFLAKKAGIPLRVGTKNRWFHWFSCNNLISLSRKNSELHEAQLNLFLLKGLNLNYNFSLKKIGESFDLTLVPPLKTEFKTLLHPEKLNIIFHPKSKGSAREWGLHNFEELIQLLPKNKFQLFISGSADDAETMKDWLNNLPSHLINISGKMNLLEFISFINNSDGLVAASTGPLHIAAALQKNVLGIYPAVRPVFAKRWAPLGKNANYLEAEIFCENCTKKTDTCDCMDSILPEKVLEKILNWNKLQ